MSRDSCISSPFKQHACNKVLAPRAGKVWTCRLLPSWQRQTNTQLQKYCGQRYFACCVRKTNVSVGRFRRLTVMIMAFQRFRLSLSLYGKSREMFNKGHAGQVLYNSLQYYQISLEVKQPYQIIQLRKITNTSIVYIIKVRKTIL